MAKQKSSDWLDKYTAAVSDATAQAKPGPVFLGNPYAKEMAKRQTYLNPQGKSAAPAMKQAALDRAQSEKTGDLNKKIASYAQNIGGALELAAPFTGPAMPILGAIGTGLDVGGSAYLAGKDISEGNYGSAITNASFGALGAAGFAPMVKYNRGLNAAVNTVDDVSDIAGLYNSYDNLGREYAGKLNNTKKINISKADFAKWDKEILDDKLTSTADDKYWDIYHDQSKYTPSDINTVDDYTLHSHPFHSDPNKIKQLDEIITKQKGESFPLVRHFDDGSAFKIGLQENDLLKQHGELSPNRALSFSAYEGVPEFGKNRMLLTKPEEQSYLKTGSINPGFDIGEREIVLPSKLNYKVNKVLDNTYGGKDYHVNITNPYLVGGLPIAGAAAMSLANQPEQQKNGGWLDKYEEGGELNYNDSSVSAPEGFQGDGYSNVGRNYSPAWGGQFQMGGSMPGAVGFMYARTGAPSKGPRRNQTTVTDASAQDGIGLPFISDPKLRNTLEGNKSGLLQPSDYKLPEGRMAGSIYPSSEVSRSVGGEDGEPAYLIPSFKYGAPLQDYVGEYNRTGQHLGGPFKTWQEADAFGKLRHQYIDKEYKTLPSPIKTWGDGFQNGGEMKYYQEGLDFKPKSISKNGSVIKDDRGQWDHPGEITEIGSNQITMQGVPYPVLGISDTGDTQMMYPNEDYTYEGSSVTEYPMMKEGGALQLTKLDQLTNFTNYNTKQPGGWLDKYQD